MIIIIASLVATKKSSKGFPAEPNLPSAVPNTTLNITIPRTFVVAEFTCLKFHRYSGTGGRIYRLIKDDINQTHKQTNRKENLISVITQNGIFCFTYVMYCRLAETIRLMPVQKDIIIWDYIGIQVEKI